MSTPNAKFSTQNGSVTIRLLLSNFLNVSSRAQSNSDRIEVSVTPVTKRRDGENLFCVVLMTLI